MKVELIGVWGKLEFQMLKVFVIAPFVPTIV